MCSNCYFYGNFQEEKYGILQNLERSILHDFLTFEI